VTPGPRAAAALSGPSVEELLVELARAGVSEVDAGSRRRAEYSSDASNYRVVPRAVVFPRTVDEVIGAVETARALNVPVTSRGGGTSVAGNAVGEGIVVDFSRHLDRILDIDIESRVATVEPGVILGALQRRAAPFGLRFGPDPSTSARCTIGGMIGNNACGPRALAFGRTADNVLDLDVIDGRGRIFTAGADLSVVPGLDSLVSGDLAAIRTELGSFGRKISGYSLEHLLPENGANLAKALVGTEGTAAVVLGARVRLVDIPQAPILVVLGYSSMADAADAVPALLPLHPVAIEGLDARIVDSMRLNRGASAVPELPAGHGWLLVEVADREPGDAVSRAQRVVAAAGTKASRILQSGGEANAIWRLREDGAGLAGRTQSGRQAWPGLEDAAVPPENLGAYLREFEGLLADYHLEGMPYGHFGDGCVHVRLDIPLEHDGSTLRSFMVDAAKLIASYGGSLSGEHGDGRARSELLPYMYSPRMIDLFARFKTLFDPKNVLNPGVIASPASLDVDLRRPAARQLQLSGGFSFSDDNGDFTSAVHRCVGIGKCRADNTSSGGFMCPSFLATGDEKDSTRGRARVLQEMANGRQIAGGWDAPEVLDSLDLCLSCKACSSDCPAGVDMAAYKSEALYRRYKGKRRPISHYTLGWMPRWARVASRFATVANMALAVRPLEQLVLAAGGMDTRRRIPRFARKPFRAWWRRRATKSVNAVRPSVLLWMDTFSDNFTPSIGRAAVELLEDAGYEVIVPPDPVCCGLTWITTGQLDGAKRRLAELLDVFGPYAESGMPILGMEPSCTAVLRSDLTELFPDDLRARLIADRTVTLAELLTSGGEWAPSPDWVRPDLTGTQLIVQPHCHHHSVMGFDRDENLLRSLGADITVLAGCCGLAGNFGMERGHYDVSVAVAENSLLPRLREAPEGSVFLADGLSCRTQADQLAHFDGVHLVELLAAHRVI
jgi:FAD/FMN-containing dehydrogenase/Fe-S oxidoreductase